MARDVTRRAGRTHMLPDHDAASGRRREVRAGPERRARPQPERTRSGTGDPPADHPTMTQATAPGRSPTYARVGTAALALTLWIAVIPAHAQSPHTPPGPADLEYRLPVDDVVLRRFERPAHRWSPGHRGVDVSASVGTPVLAPADGVVTVSRRVVDRDVLTIEHPDGLRSSLEPLADGVPEGTPVVAGSVVGTVAEAGAHCGGADCLHWGVRRGSEYLDPLSLLPGASPVVLLSREASRHSPGAWSAVGASRRCASGRCATR